MKPTLEQIKTDESVWPEGATHYSLHPEVVSNWLNNKIRAFYNFGEWVAYPENGSFSDHLVNAIPRPTKAFVPEIECKTIYWVAEVDDHGTPWNFDGPHDTHEGAKDSIPFLLGINGKNRNLIVTSMQFHPIKSEREKLIDLISLHVDKGLNSKDISEGLAKAFLSKYELTEMEPTK